MKRAAIVAILTSASFICDAQHVTGDSRTLISIGGVSRHNVMTLGIWQKISEHWSIYGETWIDFSGFINEDNEYKVHNDELSQVSIANDMTIGNSHSIGMAFWPEKVHSGLYLGAGAGFSSDGNSWGILKAGYIMRIFSICSARISYGIEPGRKNEYFAIGLCINI